MFIQPGDCFWTTNSRGVCPRKACIKDIEDTHNELRVCKKKKKKQTQKLSSTVHFFYPAPIKGKGMLLFSNLGISVGVLSQCLKLLIF